jgi:phage baseplate assembly protein W
MSPRGVADLQLLQRQLGVDLALEFAGPGGYWEDADLVDASPPGSVAAPVDLGTTDELEAAATQFLVDLLKTQQGELAALGHPDYGSRHHELIGQPNNLRTQNLIKVYVLEALAREPRVEKVLSADVYATSSPPRDTVRIDLTIQLISQPNPLNLVVPFSLEVAA